MIPSDHFFVGGGSAATSVTPVAALLLMLSGALILFGPRRYVLVPLLLGVFLVPTGNVVVLGGFHMMPIRLLAPLGWLRLAVNKPRAAENRFAGGYGNVDRAFLGCCVATAIAVCLQWMSTSAVTNQLGILVGTLGMFFLLRQLIRDDEDIALAVKLLVTVAGINVLCMIIEWLTLQNLFGTVIGGVQDSPLIREGKIRAQGAFQHAILAGVYGATVLPLSLWLLNMRRWPGFAILGIVSATVMTVLSSSSTPVMAYGGMILAICLWPMRRDMRLLRWGFSLTLVILQMAMKAPVWFLMARVDVIGGSASFDRAYLIDTCVRHFRDWWLCGTHDSGNWGWSMWDLSNQFVSIAETGGLLGLIFFIAIIYRCFGRLGSARKAVDGVHKKEWRTWLLGCALFSHVMAYFGVSYFDQTQVTWFVLLAIISVTTSLQFPVEIHTNLADDIACSPEWAGMTSDSPEPSWRTTKDESS
jgi:hypothetical protein